MTLRRRHLLLAAAALAAAPAHAAGLPPPRTQKVFGARLRYLEAGRRSDTRPTLVLLHGLGSSAAGDWGLVMPALARTHHVLALDQLGFGGSDKPVIDYGIQTWVDFLGEFLRLKKIGRFVLVGESMGGWVAARYTLQALAGTAAGPSFVLPRPEGLVLCDAAGFRDSAPAAGGPPLSVAGEKALLAKIFHGPAFNSEQAVRDGIAWTLGKGDSAIIHAVMNNPALWRDEAVDGLLGGITVPTLVVWGRHDQLLPLALGERYAREIPGAKLVVIEDSGHLPMIESPTAFVAAVQGFLGR